jgi:VCBS repeat-containing protein
MSAAVVLSPFVIAAPTVMGAVVTETGTTPAVIQSIESKIEEQLAGRNLYVGDIVVIDLDEIFEDADTLSYSVIIQNGSVADVSIVNGELQIRMKKTGTTMVNIAATKPDQTTSIHERFRLTTELPNSMDYNNDGVIRIDDIVKYMNANPDKQEDEYRNLLSIVDPFIPLINQSPSSSTTITQLSVAKNDSILLDMNDYFSDDDGDLLTYALQGLPSHGLNSSFELESDGLMKITGLSYSSPVTITVRADDNHPDRAGSITHQFQVSVQNTAAPAALADSYELNEDAPLTVDSTFGVLHNDSDANLDVLETIVVTGPSHGSLSLNPDGSFVYTPNANYVGADSFTYKASDRTHESDVVTVNLTVIAVNDAPIVALVEMQSILEDGVLMGQLLATDIDLDTLTYSLASQAGHGVSSVDSNTGAFSYTPSSNYYGTDTFSINISDDQGGNVAVPINVQVIAVNDEPTASVAIPVSVDEDGVFTGQVTTVTDVDGDALTYSVTKQAAHGTVTITDATYGAYSYSPFLNYNGPDSFIITANDGNGGSVPVAVSVTVTSVNDEPTTTVAAPVSVSEDGVYTGQVTAVTDVDGDVLNYSVTQQAAHGIATITNAMTGTYSYSPTANYNGPDTFTITANDGKGGSVSVPVSVTVTPVNDAPTATDADPVSVDEDGVLTGQITTVTDVDGDALTYSVSQQAANGFVTITNATTGAYSYSPDGNFGGSDTFTITANDGKGKSVSVPVSVTVTPVNDAPTATVAAPVSVDEDGVFRGQVTTVTDVDGDILTYSVTQEAAHGIVTITDTATGTYSYRPYPNYNGSDTFTITASDGKGGSVSVPISITVTSVNDIPATTDADPVSVDEDGVLTGQVTTVTDVDGDVITHGVTQQAANGIVTITNAATGAYSYSPNENYNGPDSFTITASDGKGGTVSVPISVAVSSVNDTPTTTDAAPVRVDEDGIITGQITTVTDVDGDALTYSVTQEAAHGIVTITDTTTGTYSYSPYPNYNGPDTFTISANDSKGGSVSVPVSVTVTSVNDTPTSTDADPLTVFEDGALTGQVTTVTDVDGDVLTYSVTQQAAHGIVTIINATTGAYSYSPYSNYNGPDTFTITASDGKGGIVSVPISVTVTSVNDIPTTTDADLVTVVEDDALTGQITTVTDVDGDALTYSVTQEAVHGIVTITDITTGTYSFSPYPDYNGSDTFTITANDGKGGSVSVPVSVTVTPVNDAPTASDAYPVSVDEDVVLTSQITTVTDLDGDALTYSVTQQAAKGIVTIINATTGTYSYSPNTNYNGSDTFTITASDGKGGTLSVPISVTIMELNDAPTATVADPASVDEDSELTSQITTVTDIEGDALTYSVSQQASNGIVTIIDTATGTYSYSPNANYNGLDTYTITASDGRGGSVSVPVSVTVASVNDTPTTTNADPVSVDEDGVLTGQITTVTDLDGDALIYSVTQQAANGIVTIINPTTGTYSYSPNANYNGLDTFTITAIDGKGGTVSVSISVTIMELNDAPTATVATPVSVDEDGALTGQITTVTDVDGDALIYSVTEEAAHGIVTITDPTTGTYSYSPDGNFGGSDTFTITANDGKGGSVSVPVSVTVTPVNDAPTATDADPVSVNEDGTLTGQITTVTDLEGDALTYSVTQQAVNGIVTIINPTTGTYSYSPKANYSGSDTFTITANDSKGGTVSVPISVTIMELNDAPTATVAAPVSVDEDGILTGQITTVTDVDGDALTYSVTKLPANGTVTITDATYGSYIYSPSLNYNGPDSFTFTASDGMGGSVEVTVSVIVTPVNDAPTIPVVTETVAEDGVLNSQVTASDLDSGDTLNYGPGTVIPEHGTVIINSDGVYSYTPTSNYHGSDSFEMMVSDGKGGSASVIVTIAVTAVNDEPTATVAAPVSVEEDGLFTGQITTVTDVDGDALTYSVTQEAAHGTVTITDATYGAYSYNPNANYNGSDTFTITASDGKGGSVSVPVSVTVTTVNDTPTTTDTDPITVDEDGALTGQITTVTDVDGDTLTYSVTQQATNGIVTITNATTGTYSYSPNQNYNGSDSFTITANDGKGGTVSVPINVTVVSVNDTPTTTDADPVIVVEDGVLTSQITTVTDLDRDALTYSVSQQPANGFVMITDTATGAYSYSPNANYNGPDTFTITANDGKGGSVSVSVSVTVTPVNDAPTATDADPVSVDEDGTLTGQITTVTDLDGDALTFSVTQQAANGIVTITNATTGAYSYSPNTNYNGTDTFTITAIDGKGGTVAVPIIVTIMELNDAPTSTVAAPASVDEDGALTGQITTVTDVDGDALTYSVTQEAANGNVMITDTATGSYSYSPNVNYNGSDTFTITASDGNGGSVSVPVSVTVTPVNDAPTATDAEPVSVDEDGTLTGQMSTVTDVDGDVLTYTVTQQATNGIVTITNAATGAYSYSPNQNHNGPDTFTITASDGKGTVSVPINVTVVSVNDTPATTDADPVTVVEDSELTSQITTVTDVDGDALTYSVSQQASNGIVTITDTAIGTYSYSPNANYNGPDTFTITANDGKGGSVSVPVSLTVTSVNDIPTTTNADPLTVDEDGSLTSQITTVIDVDGDALTYTVTQQAAHGFVSITNAATGAYSYSPNQNYNGSDTFTITASDGKGGSVSIPGSITIVSVNDTPTAKDADPVTVVEDSELTSQITTVTDVDGDALTYSVSQQAANGFVTITDAATGIYSYSPDANYNGSDTFIITASDGNGGSVPVTISVTVTFVNDAPAAANEIANQAATEGVLFTFQVPSSTFADIDAGDSLTYSATMLDGSALPSWLTFHAATRTFSGTPLNGQDGTITIRVTATDTALANAAAEFTLTVQAVNDVPIVANSIANQVATEDVPFTFEVPSTTFADTDVGDSLTYMATKIDGSALPSWLTFDPETRTFSGTPLNGQDGAFTIIVTATDSGLASASARFNLTVHAVNDAPTVVNPIPDQIATEGVTFTLVVPSDTFSDVDSTSLTYTAVKPSWLSFNAAALTFSGTPLNGQDGSSNVEITATDSHGKSATASFLLTVYAVNNAPTIANPITNQIATEDTPFNFQVPLNTFADVDSTDLIYTAVKPDWLFFDAETLSFSGTPLNGNDGISTVEVTATDSLGAYVTASFMLTVNAVNDAPVVANSIANQIASEDTPFSFQVPFNTFADADSAALIYTAEKPGWLSFNAETLQFSGTPLNGNDGISTVKVTATDSSGASVTASFTLTVNAVNDPPMIHNPIADRTLKTWVPFAFTIPSNTFQDVDSGDALTYTVVKPNWIDYDEGSRTFSVIPSSGYLGMHTLRVTATDTSGAFVTDEFTWNVINNSLPAVKSDYQVGINNDGVINLRSYQSATIDLNEIFTDADGDELIFSTPSSGSYELPTVSLTNGQLLLQASASSGNFINEIPVRASDDHGATWVSHTILATVLPNPIPDKYISVNPVHWPEPLSLADHFDLGPTQDWSILVTKNNNIVNATVANSALTLQGTTNGKSTVTVAVYDGHGAMIKDEFIVTSGILTTNMDLQYMVDVFDEGIYSTDINLNSIFTGAVEYRIKSAGPLIDTNYDYLNGGWFSNGYQYEGTYLYISSSEPVNSSVTVEARNEFGDVAESVIYVRTNQAPQYKGPTDPIVMENGATIPLIASELFEDPDGDSITEFEAYSYDSPNFTIGNESGGIIPLTAAEVGFSSIELYASDGLENGEGYEYVDVNVVDKIVNFAKGQQTASVNIAGLLSGSIAVLGSSSSLIETNLLIGTTLILTPLEDNSGGSEYATFTLFNGLHFRDITIYIHIPDDESVMFAPGASTTSLNVSSYMTGFTGTVTANVYNERYLIQSVSLEGSVLNLTAYDDALDGSETIVVTLSDGLSTKYVKVGVTIPVTEHVFFPEWPAHAARTVTLNLSGYTVGMTGTVTASVYNDENGLIKSITNDWDSESRTAELTPDKVLYLTAYSFGQYEHIPDPGSGSLAIVLTDQEMITRRLVIRVTIPMTPL